jgi:hypothetical protein
MPRTTSEFEIKGWKDAAYPRQTDGAKLWRATVKKSFKGEFEGTSSAEALFHESQDGTANYIVWEQVEGRIGDRRGSFIIQHGGVRYQGGQKAFGHIVPGSGTNELSGLRGLAQFNHDEKGASLTLDYYFD